MLGGLLKKNDILLSTVRPNLKAFAFIQDLPEKSIASTGFAVLRAKEDVIPKYLFEMVRGDNAVNQMIQIMGKGAYPSINQSDIENIKIPLPPLDVQREIVAEVEACQRVIDGARMVVDHWKPNLELELEEERKSAGVAAWETVRLGEVLNFVGSGVTPLGGKETYLSEGILFIRSQNVLWGTCDFSDAVYISKEVHDEMSRSKVQKDDVLLNITGASIGRSTIYLENKEANVNQHVTILRCKKDIIPNFLMNYLISTAGQNQILSVQSGASRQALNYQQIRALEIPLPPLNVQRAIVERIEAERQIVEANRRLIELYEAKVKKIIERVWGE